MIAQLMALLGNFGGATQGDGKGGNPLPMLMASQTAQKPANLGGAILPQDTQPANKLTPTLLPQDAQAQDGGTGNSQTIPVASSGGQASPDGGGFAKTVESLALILSQLASAANPKDSVNQQLGNAATSIFQQRANAKILREQETNKMANDAGFIKFLNDNKAGHLIQLLSAEGKTK